MKKSSESIQLIHFDCIHIPELPGERQIRSAVAFIQWEPALAAGFECCCTGPQAAPDLSPG
jgi:hypothetical protein